MMPVVRLNDATFIDLKSISTWLGTKTPSETVDLLVKEEMKRLDLERDVTDDVVTNADSVDQLHFKKAPGLAFTRILSASISEQKYDKINWAGLLVRMITLVSAKGLTGGKLQNELQIPTRTAPYDKEGYKFYPEVGLSIQGQSATDAWKEVGRLAQKFSIPVEVTFQWRENPKAQHPGRVGVMKAGS